MLKGKNDGKYKVIEPVELLNSSFTSVFFLKKKRFYKERVLSVSNVLYMFMYIVPNVS